MKVSMEGFRKRAEWLSQLLLKARGKAANSQADEQVDCEDQEDFEEELDEEIYDFLQSCTCMYDDSEKDKLMKARTEIDPELQDKEGEKQ